MKKRIFLLLTLLLALAFLLPACSNKAVQEPAEMLAPDVKYEDAGMVYGYATTASEAAPAAAVDVNTGRKLIKNLAATIETAQFDACLQQLQAQATALGGYVESLQSQQYAYDLAYATRQATLVLRIPADALEAYKAAMGKQGKVVELNESVSDVTMEYTDLQAHIKALRTERDSLLNLLATASSLGDIITLQDRITGVNYELDSLESRIRLLDDQVDLSAVRISLAEVAPNTAEAPQGFWSTVWGDFKRNTFAIGRGMKDFAGGFLGSLPVLLLLAACAAAVVLVARRARRARRKKKAQQ
ncbi:MAG: DUF4349 domain-containing protein [Oscillospiraceae bacterium]|jgi:hypothetical protein|nr:DUF4349 domain-containing protein [Oscillospiraceae bacterium]